MRGFESSKVRALLAYLALGSQRAHSRDALAGLLWPEVPDASARQNLRQALTNLRRVLHDAAHPASPYLLVTTEAVRWNPERLPEVDALTFSRLLEDSTSHPHRRAEACHSCALRRARALDLYRGPLLEGFFIDSEPLALWLDAQRAHYQTAYLSALEQSAAHFELGGDLVEMERCARRLLEVEPWHEPAHRRLMRSLASRGERGAALAHYKKMRQVLRAELEVEPEPETQALYRQIAAGEPVFSAPAPAAPEGSLPHPLTPLTGRGRELEQLLDRLERTGTRLVTLAGLGGVGKTRLALAAGHALASTFSGGVFFVPLAGVDGPQQLIFAAAAALGFPLAGLSDPFEQLISRLRGRDLLLILDDFDQLVEHAPLVADLLQRTSRLTLLVTARQRLELPGEWVLELEGLPVETDALALFLERARMTGARLDDSPDMHAAARHICQLLEGLPLALELAAAWTRDLPLDEIESRLQEGLRLLEDEAHTPRTATNLRPVFERSWAALTQEERAALAGCSVFPAEFDAAAAEQVAGASSAILASLANKSLLQVRSPGRYGLHALLRRFAAGKLDSQEHERAAQLRHLAYYQSLARMAAGHLTGSPTQQDWLHTLQREHPNLQAGVANALAAGEFEAAACLLGDLWRYWQMSGRINEGWGLLRECLAHAAHISARSRAWLHFSAGVLAWHQGAYTAAQPDLEASLSLAFQAGDRRAIAYAHAMLGFVLAYRGQQEAALELLDASLTEFRDSDDRWGLAFALYQRGYVQAMHRQPGAQDDLTHSLALFQSLEDAWGQALSLFGLGYSLFMQEDFPAAHQQMLRALHARQALGDRWLIAQALNYLGEVARCRGSQAQARAYYQDSLELFTELGSPGRVAIACHNLGYVSLHQGDPAARQYFLRGLELFHEQEHISGSAACLEGLALSAGARGYPGEAARLLGAAHTLMGETLVTTSPADRQEIQTLQRAIQARCDPATWQSSYMAGTRLSLEEALELEAALNGYPPG